MLRIRMCSAAFAGFLISGLILFAACFAPDVRANEDASDHIEAATHYMASEQWSFASMEWRNALNEDPGNIQAHLGLAEALEESGYEQQALAHLEGVYRKHPSAGVAIALADRYAVRNPERAYWLYRGVLKKGVSPEAFAGMQRLSGKLPPRLEAKLANDLDLYASTALKHAHKAYRAQEFDRTATYLDIAATRFKETDLINDYGISLLLSDDFRKANRQFDFLRRHVDGRYYVYANAGVSELSLGNHYLARKLTERAIALADSDKVRSRLFNNLGYIYEDSGKATEARFAYEKALELDPANLQAELNLAYILEKLQNYDEAINRYRKLLDKYPENAEYVNRLGFAYEQAHDYRRARKTYERAVRLNPGYIDAYYNLSTVYKKMDEMDKALETYRQMMEVRFDHLQTGNGRKAEKPQKPPVMEYMALFPRKLDQSPDKKPMKNIAEKNAEASVARAVEAVVEKKASASGKPSAHRQDTGRRNKKPRRRGMLP